MLQRKYGPTTELTNDDHNNRNQMRNCGIESGKHPASVFRRLSNVMGGIELLSVELLLSIIGFDGFLHLLVIDI